jgi:alcohol dehydrogenase, propanol-preferring
MKAARLHAYGEPLALEQVPDPEPGPGQVLVKVEGAGFCHSDVHVMDGEVQILPRLPVILGHENAGTVAALGPGVTGLSEGQPVAVWGGWGDGTCDYCVTGREQLCQNPQWVGLSQHDGGYAEYLLVPHARYLVPLSRLAPALAAPLVDAALTPYRAVKRSLPHIEPDHSVLAIGIGGLGQYGIRLLRLLTGARIIAVDITERKLEIAREYGADVALDGRDPEIARQVVDASGGKGVTAALDFVGSDASLGLAITSTRALGRVSQIGLAGGTARMKVLENARFEVLFEATLWGTIKELREVIALAESGRLQPIATEFAPLDQINTVYERVKRGEVEGRIVVTP